MNCLNCGGTLTAKSNICPYCRSVNDIDLRDVFKVAGRSPESSRQCPHCATALETLDLGVGQRFLIERCPHCLGMFFDPGELDAIVAARAETATRIDFDRLVRIVEEETPAETWEVQYIKCPSCHELMNRRRFGARCGVIADECARHGIWLDGGELRRILAWVRAGGPVHNADVKVEQSRRTQRERKFDRTVAESREAWDTPSDPTPVSMSGGLFIDVLASLLRY